MVKLDGRGERVNNSLGASQFSRHLSLNRESRQPVCPSSSPLKHSAYTSERLFHALKCVISRNGAEHAGCLGNTKTKRI